MTDRIRPRRQLLLRIVALAGIGLLGVDVQHGYAGGLSDPLCGLGLPCLDEVLPPVAVPGATPPTTPTPTPAPTPATTPTTTPPTTTPPAPTLAPVLAPVMTALGDPSAPVVPAAAPIVSPLVDTHAAIEAATIGSPVAEVDIAGIASASIGSGTIDAAITTSSLKLVPVVSLAATLDVASPTKLTSSPLSGSTQICLDVTIVEALRTRCLGAGTTVVPVGPGHPVCTSVSRIAQITSCHDADHGEGGGTTTGTTGTTGSTGSTGTTGVTGLHGRDDSTLGAGGNPDTTRTDSAPFAGRPNGTSFVNDTPSGTVAAVGFATGSNTGSPGVTARPSANAMRMNDRPAPFPSWATSRPVVGAGADAPMLSPAGDANFGELGRHASRTATWIAILFGFLVGGVLVGGTTLMRWNTADPTP